MNTTTKEIEYTMGRSQDERKRLVNQSRLYGDFTQRLIVNSGITSGMRILDIGSGSGDVALAAAEQVGPDGEVVGIDMNGEILNNAAEQLMNAGHSNTTFIQGDIQSIELEGEFDAIIGRLVLMYLPNPVETIKHLMQYLKPNGIVAFQEVDFSFYRTYGDPSTPLINQLANWMSEAFKCTGANITIGRELNRVFIEAGLPRPLMDFSAPIGGDEHWTGYQLVEETFQSLLPLLEKYNIVKPEDLDISTLAKRVKQEVLISKKPLIITPHICAWSNLS